MGGTAVKKWHKRKNTAAEGYERVIFRLEKLKDIYYVQSSVTRDVASPL
jgi:hypothetical protein